MDQDDATDRFLRHELSDDASKRLGEMNHGFVCLASIMVRNVPDSREKSLAMTKLEEASMWAARAIARNQEP